MTTLYSYKYPHPAVTTDCVIFGFDGERLNVLLIARGIDPYKGIWALPGGFMKIDESAEQCARRELREETGLDCTYLRQFHTFSSPGRDPRERVVTVAFYALVKMSDVTGGDDASDARWFFVNDLPQLAFDHRDILEMALEELRRQIHFEPVGFKLLDDEFTMKSLQKVYEAILNIKFDRRNFFNKMRHTGVLQELGSCPAPDAAEAEAMSIASAPHEPSRESRSTRGKPATLFTLNIKKYLELKRGNKNEF